MRYRTRIRPFVVVVASLALLSAPALAELLRCKGPDGKTIFTDKKERCPGAEAFEPSTKIQKVPGGAPAAPPPAGLPSRRDLEADAEKDQAQQWAAKKRAAEDELKQIAAQREWMGQIISHCNRGGSIVTRDDAGIKRSVSCAQIRQKSVALDQREAELQSYLRDGLKEECRRAGCLPGWIR